MKNIILFGIGINGKKILDAYQKYDYCFRIVAIADNFSDLTEIMGISVIKPYRILDLQYDEIWIATVYYQEIKEQLIEEFHIERSVIRYVEFPMPFLEQQVYKKYKEEIKGKKHCESSELQTVIDYVASKGVRMYCYPFFDEYIQKDYQTFYDIENGLYYGIYAGHKMYLSRAYNTPQKARQYLRYIHMEQDPRSPHCYFTKYFQIDEGRVGIDVGAAEGVFALEVLDKIEHIYLIEADADWCEALSWTFRDYEQKVTIMQGIVSDMVNIGQLVLDAQFVDVKVDFIKMDIEGAEKKALLGAQELLKRNMPKLAVCTYHNKSDYLDIGSWLLQRGFSIKNSKGYVICQGEWELEHISDVDFRRALLWAEKDAR